jgi:DNA-binding MarR family transcriptional regulator
MDFWAKSNSIVRLSRQIAKKRLKPLGLTTNEGNILLSIFNCKAVVNQDYLADQLDIDKTIISRAVSSLETKGFVTREIDASDRRAYQLLLTAKARHNKRIIERIYSDIFCIAKKNVPIRDVGRSIKTLSQIADNFIKSK